MALYLGRVGALVQLPSPKTGMARPWVRRSAVQATIGGGQVVSYAPGGRRTYQPRWEVLTPAQYAVLEEIYTGAGGPGPYLLLDTQRRNHLAPNQAGAGSVDYDGTGFTPSSGESVDAVDWPYVRGPRSLRWQLPPAGTSAGVLRLDGPGGLTGWPVLAGQPWTFSCEVCGGGADQAVTLTPVLAWLDSTGFEVATTIGSPVATAASVWAAASVSAATPPVAAAVYVRPELRATAGSYASGSTGRGDAPIQPLRRAFVPRAMFTADLGARGGPAAGEALHDFFFGRQVEVFIDRPQLELAAAASAWRPGTGLPRVSIPELADAPIWQGQVGPIEATFIEVG